MDVPLVQHTDDLIIEIISLEYVHAITLVCITCSYFSYINNRPELATYVKLKCENLQVQKVHKFLGSISKCLRGIQSLTSEIANSAQALMMHQVCFFVFIKKKLFLLINVFFDKIFSRILEDIEMFSRCLNLFTDTRRMAGSLERSIGASSVLISFST